MHVIMDIKYIINFQEKTTSDTRPTIKASGYYNKRANMSESLTCIDDISYHGKNHGKICNKIKDYRKLFKKSECYLPNLSNRLFFLLGSKTVKLSEYKTEITFSKKFHVGLVN